MHRLLLLALAACSVPTAAAEDWSSSSRTDTPYSCEGIVAAPQVATVDPQVIEPWHELAVAPMGEAWAEDVRKLADTWRPGKLTIEGKVRIQHEMLEIAHKLDGARRYGGNRGVYAEAHRRVMKHVRAIAPAAWQLDELGDGSQPAVQSILGLFGVVERATRTCGTGNSLHVAHHDGLLAFRPLRNDTTRALVAQLVAFDTEGKPHITPLVAGMELRLGNEVASPACIVQAELDGTLAVRSLASLEQHAPFVRREATGLSCRGCHRNESFTNARDLTAAEVKTIDVARNRQVDRLANELWKSLTDPTGAR